MLIGELQWMSLLLHLSVFGFAHVSCGTFVVQSSLQETYYRFCNRRESTMYPPRVEPTNFCAEIQVALGRLKEERRCKVPPALFIMFDSSKRTARDSTTDSLSDEFGGPGQQLPKVILTRRCST